MQSSDFKIKSYQVLPIRHLLDKCRTQKGVLVWHEMGTGKSATGLCFIASLVRLKTVLLLPETIIDVWRAESVKMGLPSLDSLMAKRKIIILTFNDPIRLKAVISKIKRTNFALVVDEAHNLIRLLQSMQPSEAYKLLCQFKSFSKIVLMTGTPMFEKETDLRILVNIAAGKDLLPIQIEEYHRIFYKTSIWRSVVIGWILSFFSKALYQTRDVANAILNYDFVVQGPSSVANQFYSILTSAIQVVFGNFYISAAIAVAIPVIIPIILLILINLALKSQTHKIRHLDAHKLAKHIQSYVSFYEIPNTARGNDYAKITIVKQKSNYNASQIDFWLRFAMGRLIPAELMRIGVSKSEGEAFYFGDVTQVDDYKFYGRAIGNLAFEDSTKHLIESPKFLSILNLMKDNASTTGNLIPTVIYSNFEDQGSKLFASFLRRKAVKFTFLNPDMTLKSKLKSLKDFKNGKISVIILHPALTEGISIFGARQMHILEPLLNQSTFEQLIARVIRFQSHSHLPIQDRNVRIFTWRGVATSFYARLIKFGQEQKLWGQHQIHMGPWVKASRFANDITPDGLIESRDNILETTRNSLRRELKKNSIDSLSVHETSPRCLLATDDTDRNQQSRPICNHF